MEESIKNLDALHRRARDKSNEAVAQYLAQRKSITRSHGEQDAGEMSFGQRAADAVARFGGSWTFILVFFAVLVSWVGVNAYLLAHQGKTFDPYPYILLNLFLSMLASIQAPVILMAQNRQGELDRVQAKNDYEVNLKAELEIMALHEKIDLLKGAQWEELIGLQREQLRLLGELAARQPERVA